MDERKGRVLRDREMRRVCLLFIFKMKKNKKIKYVTSIKKNCLFTSGYRSVPEFLAVSCALQFVCLKKVFDNDITA